MNLTKLVVIFLLLDLPGPLVAMAAPIIVTQPAPQTVPVGYPAYFAVEATNSLSSPMNYLWLSNGVPIVTAANTNFYTIPSVGLGASNAVFTVIVTNSTGSVTSSINGVLTVLASVPTVFTLPPFYVCATNYYVATNGNNTYTAAQAQNPNTPWLTISNALKVLQNQGGSHGGVCVNVGDGVYNENIQSTSVSGSSDTTNGYFVLRSQNPHGVTIMVPSNAPNPSYAIQFFDANYVVFDGFVVVGDHLHGDVNGAGVELSGSTNNYACNSHHCRVYNNIIYGFGGAAIHGEYVDYIELRNNVCFSCAATYSGGSSAIDCFHPVALDSGAWDTGDAANAGFHIIIGDNICFNNFECNNIQGGHGDGHGIICDDFNGTKTNLAYGDPGILPYTNRTLVEGNLCFNNGGSGILLGGGGASYVTARNNTCFNNSGDDNHAASVRGEIETATFPGSAAGVQSSHDNTVVNNICRAIVGTGTWTPDNKAMVDVSGSAPNTNNVYLNNLTFNGTAGVASLNTNNTTAAITSANGNLLGTDPHFTSETNFDFTLQLSSHAIDAGTTAAGLPALDLNGQARPLGRAVDLGAYEFPYSLLITSIVHEGSNVRIYFTIGPGSTNALQADNGDAFGGINAGGFTNIFIVTSNAVAGAVTNFLDVGAVANFPSRYYRVQLAP